MELDGTAIAIALSLISLISTASHWAVSRRDRAEDRENKRSNREVDRLAVERREESLRVDREKESVREDLRRIEKKIDDALGRLSRLEGVKD